MYPMLLANLTAEENGYHSTLQIGCQCIMEHKTKLNRVYVSLAKFCRPDHLVCIIWHKNIASYIFAKDLKFWTSL